MKSKYDWPRGPTSWIESRILMVSVPFTWNLPKLRMHLSQRSFEWDRAIVGGPATFLMPEALEGMDHVTVGKFHPYVLQRVNPMATRTTAGCIRACKYCAVPRMEGRLMELPDWPDLPVIMDNNLLAARLWHFDRVIDRLSKWRGVDFNQGLDARLLNEHHAIRLAELKSPTIRLACDSGGGMDTWESALDLLRTSGVPVRDIRSYALIGFDTDPSEAWERANRIASHGIKVSLGWFHTLNALEVNVVTKDQQDLGWTDPERKKIMQHFYQYKKKGDS